MEPEVKQTLDSCREAINTVTDIQKKHGDKLDALENEKFNKAAEDIASSIEKIQQLEQKNAAAEERIKDLEALKSKGVDVNKQEFSKEDEKAYIDYMRFGKPMPESQYRKCIEYVAESKMVGATDAEKKLYVDSEMQKHSELSRKEMSAGSNADGGYTIIPQYDMSMRTRLFETSPMRNICTVMTLGANNDSIKIVLDDDEAAAGWIGETAARPTTDSPQIGQVTISLAEAYANPRATQTLIDRSPWNIPAYMGNKAVDKINRLANYAYILGDGSSKPKGILAYSAWTTAETYERGKVEQITGTDATNGFNGDDLLTLEGSVHEEYQPGSVLICNRRTFYKNLLKIKVSGTGEYAFDRYLLLNGGKREVLGHPLVIMNDMPDVATDALSFAYGNFKEGYLIVDGIGFRILRDPYSAKPYVQFYTTFNTGGGVVNFEAFKILKMNTVA